MPAEQPSNSLSSATKKQVVGRRSSGNSLKQARLISPIVADENSARRPTCNHDRPATRLEHRANCGLEVTPRHRLRPLDQNGCQMGKAHDAEPVTCQPSRTNTDAIVPRTIEFGNIFALRHLYSPSYRMKSIANFQRNTRALKVPGIRNDTNHLL